MGSREYEEILRQEHVVGGNALFLLSAIFVMLYGVSGLIQFYKDDIPPEVQDNLYIVPFLFAGVTAQWVVTSPVLPPFSRRLSYGVWIILFTLTVAWLSFGALGDVIPYVCVMLSVSFLGSGIAIRLGRSNIFNFVESIVVFLISIAAVTVSYPYWSTVNSKSFKWDAQHFIAILCALFFAGIMVGSILRYVSQNPFVEEITDTYIFATMSMFTELMDAFRIIAK